MTNPVKFFYVPMHADATRVNNAWNNNSNFEQIKLSEIGQEKYLVLFFITNVSWISKNLNKYSSSSYPLMPPRVVKDVYAGQARLVFIQMFEGQVFQPPNPVHDYEVINEWCRNRNFSASQVHYIHENFNHELMPEQQYFTLHSFTTFFCWLQQDPVSEPVFEPEDSQYLYLLYNRANRLHRWALGARLLERDLLRLGKCSYQILGPDKSAMSKWFSHHPELSELIPAVQALENMCPLTLEYSDLQDNNPVHLINNKHHSSTFMSIVTETLYKGELFFSEKIWKPVIAGQPFLLLSSPGSLALLRQWGFQTFDQWFDESYDDMPHMIDRVNCIVDQVHRLSNMSQEQLQQMRQQMMPVIKHNQQRYVELRAKTCERLSNPTSANGVHYYWGKLQMPMHVLQKIWADFTDTEPPVPVDYNKFG